MKTSDDNPASNKLGAGVSEDDLREAISSSGFPLQSRAVDALLGVLGTSITTQVQEEWSYVDSDQGTLRTLDALVMHEITPPRAPDISGLAAEPNGFLRLHLDLLIECKQAELPFVFFLRPSQVGDIPRLAGLPHSHVSILFSPHHDDSASMRIADAIGLSQLPFTWTPPTAISMSKVCRSGRKLTLSGDDAFRNITFPLGKGLAHYLSSAQPGPNRLYYDIRFIFPLVVLQAPMIGVHMADGKETLEAIPWARLVRTDPADSGWSSISGIGAFDVVHIDYLGAYAAAARTVAIELATRIDRFAIPILTGEAAIATDLAQEEPTDRTASDAQTDEEALPFASLQPRLSSEEFKLWVRRRSAEVHSPED